MIDYFIAAKVPLPQFEQVDGIDAAQIHAKVTEFLQRLPTCSSDYADFMQGYFLELLRYYPKSLCSREMTDALKLLISIWYQHSKLTTEDYNKENGGHFHAISYEDLAILFVRSKASIHIAIEAKGNEALYHVKVAREGQAEQNKQQSGPQNKQLSEPTMR